MPPDPSPPTLHEVRSVVDDLALEPVAGIEGRFTAVIDEGWRVLHTFGGMTKAWAIEAAHVALGRDDLQVISAQSTYVQAVPPGRVAIQADVVRSGRRGAQVSVRLWSTDSPHEVAPAYLCADVVFGGPDAGATDLTRVRFPHDAKTPESSAPREEFLRSSIDIPFHRQTDWRLAQGAFDPDEAEVDLRSISWFRFQRSPIGPTGAWHPPALAVPGDILGPAVSRGLGGRLFFVITLQLSLQWLAPVRSEWVCQHATAIAARGGFVTGTADLWSEDHELVGFATQVAMLRPFERVAADGLVGTETQG